ncbi:MAG TPA: DUF1684 domain-containing protein [Vicinamibacterales bacterium]|nr:DUF1684 domain-containing protein [Vicinamibacterales bacterium]
MTVTRFVVLAWAAGLSACAAPERSYPDVIGAWRAEKDAFMRSAESPVPAEQRADFPALQYYPVDERFRVPAALTVGPGEDLMEMSTSTGTRRTMRRIGALAFTIDGQRQTLTAFAEANDRTLERLFVPFGDPTNQSETYRGGRYLDLDRTATGLYDLDFNRAYHPFCVFNPTYECPVPPRENQLTMAIHAGERLPRP